MGYVLCFQSILSFDFSDVKAVDEKSSQNNQEAVNRPTLSGDFYPYGDVYVSGEPAYWTGFYGTRPYWKKFHRELENELRSAEILFTYANMLAKRTNSQMELKVSIKKIFGLSVNIKCNVYYCILYLCRC